MQIFRKFSVKHLAIACLAAAVPASQGASAAEEAAPVAIFEYVRKAEPAYQWSILKEQTVGDSQVMYLHVTSQTWQEITWEHAVEIFTPKTVLHPRHALLFVTGGSQPPRPPSEENVKMGLQLAQAAGMRVVMLHQVPNQPLFENRVEDDLITETWLQYLKNGDASWPLLFPMVKSAVKTMDAVQELAAQKFDQPIESFVITGASKRGWTSWLTPVVDQRVVATAPIVIDVLNFRAQMKHQKDTWGTYSEQIHDYTSKGLIVEGDESDRERQLRMMMDPWSYRDQLTLPKFLVNGTNDQYWVVDAMKLYWDDLKGPKHALFIPNAGHGLDGGREKALRSIAAFAQLTALQRPLPQLTWAFHRDGATRSVSLESSEQPSEAALWSAQSDDLDFRDEQWSSQPLSRAGDAWTGTVIATEANAALYADLTFEVNGVPYSVCTLIHRD